MKPKAKPKAAERGFERAGPIARHVAAELAAFASGGQLLNLPLSSILEPELPAREKMDDDKMRSLQDSLRAQGQLIPILVVKRGANWEVADGHRRYIAFKFMGWPSIRALAFEKDGLDLEAAKVHVMLEREDWNPAEEATYYDLLMKKHRLDLDGLCALVKRGENYISDRMRLIRGDPRIFQALREGLINFGVARELNKVTDEAFRGSYLDQAIRSGTSWRVVASWVQGWRDMGSPRIEPATPNPASVAVGADQGYHRRCTFCGGDLDQQNLVDVVAHGWELEMLKAVLKTAGERGISLQGLREQLNKGEHG